MIKTKLQCAILLQWILSLYLLWRDSSLNSNLTGLFWLEEHWLPVLVWCLLTLGLLAALSYSFYLRVGMPAAARISFASCLILLAGLLIPFSNASEKAWLSSLHLLFSIAGFSGFLICALWSLASSSVLPAEKKTAGAILLCAAGSLGLFSLTGSVNLASELFFGVSAVLVLLAGTKKGEDHSS